MKNALISLFVITILAIGGYFIYATRTAQADSAKATTSQTLEHLNAECPVGTTSPGLVINGKPVCELEGIITRDLKLNAKRYWRIRGEVQIGEDNAQSAVLHIVAGTHLFGKGDGDFLVINRGSKIMAEGSAYKPIVFTSENDLKNSHPVSGEWGGVVIAGNAPINSGNLDEAFEFSHRQIRFGGGNPHDDSGLLNYVIIKYAGDEVLPQKELNGLSLGGVGDRTVIDYVEVYKGKDDGIEVWGGTVNMKHILLLGNRDDSFDTDMGYHGNIQYLYAEKFRLEAGQYGNGLEADNLKADMTATPVSHPILANFELVGSSGSNYGILLRRGTGYTLINGAVTGFAKAQLAIHDAATLTNREIAFASVALDAVEEDGDLYESKVGVSEAEVKSLFVSSALCKTGAIQTTPSDVRSVTGNPFFDKAAFVGSHAENDDWRTGWSYGLQ